MSRRRRAAAGAGGRLGCLRARRAPARAGTKSRVTHASSVVYVCREGFPSSGHSALSTSAMAAARAHARDRSCGGRRQARRPLAERSRRQRCLGASKQVLLWKLGRHAAVARGPQRAQAARGGRARARAARAGREPRAARRHAAGPRGVVRLAPARLGPAACRRRDGRGPGRGCAVAESSAWLDPFLVRAARELMAARGGSDWRFAAAPDVGAS